jgi:catechol 2,3-dioxygenase-like lactoylglutathione lyase family enzyme
MSFRSALARTAPALQPEYVLREPVTARRAVFRFSVPVLRVRDVATTVAWYRRTFGFTAETFPDRMPHEFAILERDGVQLLVRRDTGDTRATDGHSGWDLYLWVDGLDLRRLEASLAIAGDLVRPLSPMSASIAELEVRDPDGYVLCIGGPTAPAISHPASTFTEA